MSARCRVGGYRFGSYGLTPLMVIPVNSYDCMWCASPASGVMRLTRKCLRAFGVSGVDDLSKIGLDAPIGPQRDVWPSHGRVTIYRVEQDPHRTPTIAGFHHRPHRFGKLGQALPEMLRRAEYSPPSESCRQR